MLRAERSFQHLLSPNKIQSRSDMYIASRHDVAPTASEVCYRVVVLTIIGLIVFGLIACGSVHIRGIWKRSAIRFLNLEGKPRREIQDCLDAVCGDSLPSMATV